LHPNPVAERELRLLGKYRVLLDNLLKHNPKFRKTLEKRLNEKTVAARDAWRL
jgi:hypothetical protein